MTGTDDLNQLLDSLEEKIEPSVQMVVPNIDIPIYEGVFILKYHQHDIQVDGKIIFTWFPSKSAKFSGKAISGGLHGIQLDADVELFIDDLLFAKANLTDRILSQDMLIQGSCADAVFGDRSIAVETVRFSIPCLRDYLGETVKVISGERYGIENARLTFETERYTIKIDKVSNFTERYELLKAKGGYVILYGGEIMPKKKPLLYTELEEIIYCFNNFLYFLNGRRTGLYFLAGMFEQKEIWKTYTGYYASSYKVVGSWSNVIPLKGYQNLWVNFYKLWSDPSNKRFLELTVHWYVEANSQSAYVEGATILAQTALELIYNWLIIENKKMIIGDDALNISAANKIRLVLSQLQVSPAIPPSFKDLAALEDVNDGPEALVFIRNALVHGQEKKRNKIMAIPIHTRYEALQLGLWYIELALLYILDFNGLYKNRVATNVWTNEGEKLPWRK